MFILFLLGCIFAADTITNFEIAFAVFYIAVILIAIGFWLAWNAAFSSQENLFYAVARDITESRQAEEALRAASNYARSLLEASLDPLVTISPQGTATAISTGGTAMSISAAMRFAGRP